MNRNEEVLKADRDETQNWGYWSTATPSSKLLCASRHGMGTFVWTFQLYEVKKLILVIPSLHGDEVTFTIHL